MTRMYSYKTVKERKIKQSKMVKKMDSVMGEEKK